MPSLLQGDEDEHRYIRNRQSWVLGLKLLMGGADGARARPPPPPCSCSLGVFPGSHLSVFTNVHLGEGAPLDLRLTGAGAGGVVLQWRVPSLYFPGWPGTWLEPGKSSPGAPVWGYLTGSDLGLGLRAKAPEAWQSLRMRQMPQDGELGTLSFFHGPCLGHPGRPEEPVPLGLGPQQRMRNLAERKHVEGVGLAVCRSLWPGCSLLSWPRK